MVDITFTNPNYLWVLLLVPFMVIIHFFTLKQSKAAVIKFSNFEAIERVAKGEVLGTPYRGILKNKNIGLLILRALVYCLLIFSVAGANLSYNGNFSSSDYIFVIDASGSMIANDFLPTRLDAAKESATKFVDLVPSDANIGIVTFSSVTIINLRPTSDLNQVKDSISSIDLHKSGGTAIGDAVITATNLFNTKKLKTIILLTDGQNNVGTDPDVAIEYAKQNGVVINAIGVATKEGGNITGLNLISKLDEDLLGKIAQETNGKFFVAKDPASLVVAFKQIASSTARVLSINISWILLISAIVLLGLEWMFINTVYKSIP